VKTPIGALRAGDVFSRWGRVLILEPRDRNNVQRAALLHEAHTGEGVVLAQGGVALAYDHEADGVLQMAVRDPSMQVYHLRLRHGEAFEDPQALGGPLPDMLFKSLPVTDGFQEMPHLQTKAPIGELHALWLRGKLRTPLSVVLAASVLGTPVEAVRAAMREWESQEHDDQFERVGHG